MLFKYIKKVEKTHLKYLYRYMQTQTSPSLTKKNEGVSPCFNNAVTFADKIALNDTTGSYSYGNIFLSAKEMAEEISRKMKGRTNERVLFMCPNNVTYLISLWAIWMSGHIAVPLSPLHPQNLLLYYANDTQPQILLTSPEFKEITQRIAKNTNAQLLVLDDKLEVNCAQKVATGDNGFTGGMCKSFYTKSDALILYTSGTTGNPKGVVLTHKNLCSQVDMLLKAWKWESSDVILHTLPLNHVHGLVNALLCPLTVGAKTIMLPKFDANSVWTHLLGTHSNSGARKINMYMAVPTIYYQLLEEYERVFSKDEKMKEYIKNTLKSKFRLMVSGSAPLPESIFEKWLEISGHELLERYGMTEIGMCLSNPYDSKREPGYVGNPLPGVSVKIAQKDLKGDFVPLVESSNVDNNITVHLTNTINDGGNPSGHLLMKSDGVFKEYFRRPEATIKEFTKDGYFITGDICQYDTNKGYFKVLGRESVDIIKSGGYKLSALQIETELLNHPNVKECAAVGIPDEEWGEKVAVIVVLKKDETLTIEDLKTWLHGRLPKYSTPSVLKIVPNIPRNTMGKVNKKELLKDLFVKSE